jgi:hypothetical protein
VYQVSSWAAKGRTEAAWQRPSYCLPRAARCGGGIICRPLNVRFPGIYRIRQTMTREQLDEFGCYDEPPFVGANHYCLGEPDRDRYPGTLEIAAMRSLDPAVDEASLVVRYFRTPEAASGYHEALLDYGAATNQHAGCRTEHGIFTLITRPTRPSWPGPLIIYCVDSVPVNYNVIGEDSWEVAMAPDGTLIERFDDFGDFC